MRDFWAQSKAAVLSEVRANEHHGLTSEDARRRLRQFGANELPAPDRPSLGVLLFRQLNSPIVYILIVAAVIALLERQMTDLSAILVVVVINTGIGFYEELSAERTISKLRTIIAPTARVIRESVVQKIPAHLLVVGDIIKLEAGDRVPADARLLISRSVTVNQASLTGESAPEHKRETLVSASATLLDQTNMVFMSTLVVAGQATAVVVATGINSQFGQIASSIGRIKPHLSDLEQQLRRLGKWLTAIALMLGLIVFAVGRASGVPTPVMFQTTLAILVSIVPEGLLIALTVTLAVGLNRLYRQRVLIRRLTATEVIGNATALVLDKTGTLTEGSMMVEKIILPSGQYSVSGQGFSLTGSFYHENNSVDLAKHKQLQTLLELTALTTMSTITKEDLLKDRARQLTDPTETALAVVAAKGGFYALEGERQFPELLELPFNQETRLSASIHRFGRYHRVITKGAPEAIIGRSKTLLTAAPRRLLKESKEKWQREAESLAHAGYRVVALAYADYAPSVPLSEKMVDGLTLVGLLALADPVRIEAKESIDQAMQAGIRTIMVTGDHLLTAEHIARKLGLDRQGQVIHMQDLPKSDLTKISVIARATPQDKLMIIERLQRMGEIVAMTGDGVNDALALKQANVGIALGRSGTDIAVEAADIVLKDDQVQSILRAVSEGRLMSENIKKVAYHLVSTNLGEVLTVVGALLLGWPLPIVAVQILWLNLVTDGVTSMALTVEPAEGPLMTGRASPSKFIFNSLTISRMVVISAIMAIGALAVYGHFQADPLYARSATLTTLVFFQLFNLFNSRSSSRSIFSSNFASNRLLLILFALAAALQLVAIYFTPLAGILGLTALDLPTLMLCLTVALSIVLVDELIKLVRAGMIAWAKTQVVFNQ